MTHTLVYYVTKNLHNLWYMIFVIINRYIVIFLQNYTELHQYITLFFFARMSVISDGLLCFALFDEWVAN